ncbi:MAG: glycosyltransferase family 4 protein [bacterium]|nr:glycosyltransferase family 4 protein [bacterium]
MQTTIGIDASRNRSGGAKAHIIGILSHLNRQSTGVKEVHIWSYKELLDLLPDESWLIKHYSAELEKSLISQINWQRKKLPHELEIHGCDILFSTLATNFCDYNPTVVLCQNLLPYEPSLVKEEQGLLFKLKNKMLNKIETSALNKANGVIFLSEYSANQVQKFTGPIDNFKIIHHGVDTIFRNCPTKTKDIAENKVWNIVYVSTIFSYKNHSQIIRAVGQLLKVGYNVKMTFVGGGVISKDVKQLQSSVDPENNHIEFLGNRTHEELISIFEKTDIFLFASSCETFGITLLEGMAAGLTIACSNKSSLPEVLDDSGVYFDPCNVDSISNALIHLFENPDKRYFLAQRAKQRSEQFTWQQTSLETFRYLVSISNKTENIN